MQHCWKGLNEKIYLKSSAITQKGESQEGCYRKPSTPIFSKNDHFLPPDPHTHMYISGGKKCSFFGKFGFVFF